jgi:hypothetical protein
VTLQAKGAHVAQVALAATLDYRNYVIGVPQISPASPLLLELPARAKIELTLVFA